MPMPLKTPGFWYKKRSLLSLLLLPFSWLYMLGAWLAGHAPAEHYKPGIPVICVGNLVAGGSGKTPAALALMAELQAGKPVFLSRGYGGHRKSPGLVDPDKDRPADVGDEPLLLARAAPVIIAANRAEGAQLAEQNGFDLIVMDDGLQNTSIERDLAFVVIDGEVGFGNRLHLPAGPLRMSLAEGFARADAFILIGDDVTGVAAMLPEDVPVFQARLRAAARLDTLRSYVGFCGIGRPEKFRHTLHANGIHLASWHTFPDHHPYNGGELHRLAAEAKHFDARLITTEKDAIRIPPKSAVSELLDVFPVRLEWDMPEDVRAFLERQIGRKPR
jgi:tetraacyldisaccharide 4'-kinase